VNNLGLKQAFLMKYEKLQRKFQTGTEVKKRREEVIG